MSRVLSLVAIATATVGLVACEPAPPSSSSATVAAESTPEPAPEPEVVAEVDEVSPGAAHAAAGHVAPVDCPLAAAGHDPASLRPFEEVAEYIAFLEQPERATWQKPDAVIEALDLPPDAVVVDLGAGSGYFAFRFAAQLPEGQVEALDVEPEMVRHMHHRAMTGGVDNLHAGFADPEQPEIRDDASLVFICDVLHHVADPAAWLAHVGSQLPVGAQLALIEFKEGPLPKGPPEGLKIPRARLVEMAAAAGLRLAREHRDLLPYQTFLVFEHDA